ncbi:hypothetical protein [Paludisphaera sp.]|uniref:hypothetical protein n=1 Tax=Paludisphaera sp. TaxID=2017432 RepID=UPI00301DE9DD
MPKPTKAKAAGRTPLESLARAALDYRRSVLDAAEELGPSPSKQERDAAWRRLSLADDLLHRVVLAARDGGAWSNLSGAAALVIDGTLVVADGDDECDEGLQIHVVEPDEVTPIA